MGQGYPRFVHWWVIMLAVNDSMGYSFECDYDGEDPYYGYSSWGSSIG
jgi:hypothetical protein